MSVNEAELLSGVPDWTAFEESNQSREDEKLFVRFYERAVQDRRRTREQGRPVFREAVYIEIRTPGSHDPVAREVTEADKRRFPRHWALYEQRMAPAEEGLPLSEWTGIGRSMVEQLAFLRIKTVEQLAAVPDSTDPGIMGFGTLKDRAKRYLEAAEADQPLAALQTELEDRDKRIEHLESVNASLSERLAALEALAASTPVSPVMRQLAITDPETPAPLTAPESTTEPAYRSALDGGSDDDPEATAPRRRRRKQE